MCFLYRIKCYNTYITENTFLLEELRNKQVKSTIWNPQSDKTKCCFNYFICYYRIQIINIYRIYQGLRIKKAKEIDLNRLFNNLFKVGKETRWSTKVLDKRKNFTKTYKCYLLFPSTVIWCAETWIC